MEQHPEQNEVLKHNSSETEQTQNLWSESSTDPTIETESVYPDGYQETIYTQDLHSSSELQYLHGSGFSRYYPSLRHLIPIRKTKKKSKTTIEVDDAGLWSFITFSWLSKYVYKAYKAQFKMDDIPASSPYDTCEYNVQRMEMLWQNELAERGPKSASLGRVVWRFIRTRVIISSFIFCLNILLNFMSVAMFMRKLLEYAEMSDASIWDGVFWAVCLTLSELVRSALYSLTWAINYRTGIRLRSACLALLYKKVLRLNSLGDKSVGEMINIFGLDGQRVYDLVLFGPMVISGPLTVSLGIFYVWWLLGPWAVLGFASFFLFYPVQYGLSTLSGKLRRKSLGVTDERLTTMSELLRCIKLIKLYAWEDIFSSKIHNIRSREMDYVRKNAYCISLSSSLSSTVPYVAAIVTFLAHIAAGNTLTPSQGFPLVAFFTSQLRLSLTHTNYGISNIIDLIISCKRMKKVLLLTETSIYWSRPLNKSLSVSISDGVFEKQVFAASRKNKKNRANKKYKNEVPKSTQKKEHIKFLNTGSEYTKILHDINFFAPRGMLIGICGQVGSGKSSLLSAILGQMRMTHGKICRLGSCAYVSQQPWLINATLKENILFGEPFHSERYFRSVYCSCLNEDIAGLPGGDETEIGERGVNLSGGQKQRVALARALYANRDIYLLDDPLSSVDSHIRNEIFERYIKKALEEKTVLLVTHQIECLVQCDGIVVMKEGTIVERGTHSELMELNTEYNNMVQQWSNCKFTKKNTDCETSNKERSKDNGEVANNMASTESAGIKVLINPERLEKGSVKMYTVLSYVSACGGSLVALFVVSLMLLNVSSTAFSKWWLAIWLKKSSGSTSYTANSTSLIDFEDNAEFSTFYIVYALSVVFILVTNLIRGYFFTLVTLNSSKYIHNKLLNKVLLSPLVFFETTPVGRIQNLFSKDIEDIEFRMPVTLESLLQHLWQIIFAMLFITVVFPWFIFPLFFVSVIYYIISKMYRIGMRDIKRLEANTRSPIFSTVNATISGLETIHAFNKEKAFWHQFGSVFNQNTTCMFLVSVGSRWLAIRIDALAVLIMLVTSSLVIMLHGEVPPAMAGLAISYASTLSGMLQYMVRLMCEAEIRFLSVERINMYLHDLAVEGGDAEAKDMPREWPSKGAISFTNVYLTYRLHLPPALNNMSFNIEPQQKIGIVGRTGAGKSSIVVALLRLVEISGGKIKIDNEDIRDANLSVLRSRISVIPQDPVLFSGTLRYNLDPTGKSSDSELWSALEKTRLKERLMMRDQQLDSVITNNSLSVGEKQLICLARALLKKTKIVILDEATSGIDHETETLVLETVRTEFKNCTVLTIAHRLETISLVDKIIVVDKGTIAEFGEPSQLLEDHNSLFYRLYTSNKAFS